MLLPLPYRPLAVVDPVPPSSGAELVTVDGKSLPLVGARLTGEARGGLARLVLEQRFENRYAETLRVTYRMPLPADGAVSAYAFEIAGRTIAGRVHKKAEARERFERAVERGHTAALLEQSRADIFTQEIGNLPAGEAIVARITVDQRLVWLPEGEWELRFPTVIGPRYIGSTDTEADARETHIQVAPGQIPARIGVELRLGDALTGTASSPTHLIKLSGDRVELRGEQGARLDRDIVVRWPVATREVGISLDAARVEAGGTYGLLTIVPPAASAKAAALPRDLIVLLDTSGSMGGAPLESAKLVVAQLIESLGEADRLELIEFSDRPRRYQRGAIAATAKAKQAAIAWVRSRTADGGTEMASGVREALQGLRDGAQRQVVVVTDGYVGGEHQIVRLLHDRLPKSCRLHVLGVGSAVNRGLATALARAGRGVEVIAALEEDAERAAARLISRTRAPVLVDVTIEGSAVTEHVPEHVPDVFAGAPIVAALALRPEGGELVVRGALAHGTWEQRLRVAPRRAGEGNQAIAALYAREKVADIEVFAAIGEVGDREIERIGVEFQIATRMTSWVAVDESRAVKGPVRHEAVPQELPHGTHAASFGLRPAASAFADASFDIGESFAGELGDADEEASAAIAGRYAPWDADEVTSDIAPALDSKSYAMRAPRFEADWDGAPAEQLEAAPVPFDREVTGKHAAVPMPEPAPALDIVDQPARAGSPPATLRGPHQVAEKVATASVARQAGGLAAPATKPIERRSPLVPILLVLIALLAALAWWLLA